MFLHFKFSALDNNIYRWPNVIPMFYQNDLVSINRLFQAVGEIQVRVHELDCGKNVASGMMAYCRGERWKPRAVQKMGENEFNKEEQSK